MTSLAAAERPLGQTVVADDVALVVSTLERIRAEYPASTIAVHARAVGLVLFAADEVPGARGAQMAEERARDLEQRLTWDGGLTVRRNGAAVQLWSAAIPAGVVEHFAVSQTSPTPARLGEAWALSGHDALDLVAAAVGYGLRGPDRVVEVAGHRVSRRGDPMLDAAGSFRNACRLLGSGRIGTGPQWVSEREARS